MDHGIWEERLQLRFDGELEPEREAALDDHVAGCAKCRSEQAQLEELRAVLADGAISVRPDFTSAVMNALPPAGWEAKSARAWAMPLGLVGLLGSAAAIVAGISAAKVEPGGPASGAFGAIFGMFSTAVLAGAGLLQASWRGVGLALGNALQGSWVNLAAFGLGVIGLNVLLFRLLRRDRTAPGTIRNLRR